MKKFATLTLAGLLATSASYASQFATKQNIDCNAATDICVSVEPSTFDVHDALIQGDVKAVIQGKMRHEAKQLDWQFWEDGHYWAGVKNSFKNLEYLHLKVLSANGLPVTGGAQCQFDFNKGAVGNYTIWLTKQKDGSVVCSKSQ